MRSRSKTVPGYFSKCIQLGAPQWAGALPRIGYYTSETQTPWGNNPGPNEEYNSTISDTISPTHVERKFNNCIHKAYKGAWISGSKTIYFPSGIIPLKLTVDHTWMYKPYLGDPTGPWNTMADELASLAAGNTSSSSMLAVTLLETAKTVAMLRNPFNLLKPNFRRSVRKLTARTLANRGAGIWLEGYYGWKSLYQDVEQIAKATAHFMNDPTTNLFEKLGERLTVQKKTVDLSSQVSYLAGTSASVWTAAAQNGWCAEYGNKPTKGHFARLVNHTQSTSYTLGCRQFMQASERIATTRKLFSAAGLTSWRSVRDTIWEVIPFSFVVDWFIDTRGIWAPLNKWRLQEMDIKNLGYSSKIAGEYGVQMYVNPYVAQSMNVYPWYGQIPSSQVNAVLSSTTNGTYRLYNRFEGFPPSYDVFTQFKGKGLSFIRGVNGAALITQLLSGLKPRR